MTDNQQESSSVAQAGRCSPSLCETISLMRPADQHVGMILFLAGATAFLAQSNNDYGHLVGIPMPVNSKSPARLTLRSCQKPNN